MNALMQFMMMSLLLVRGMVAPINNNDQSANSTDEESINKFIRCPECGEQIQMVPSLTDMITAIEDHISIHREHAKSDLPVGQINAPCIREDLTEQVIIQAAALRETPKDSTWIKLE